jgi:signal transduction histidine kinase
MVRDGLIIFGLAVACCLVIGGAGLLALHGLRGRSLRWQLAVAAVTPVLAVAASVAVNVSLMFLSAHDSWVIVVALLTSTGLALGAVWVVLRRITQGSRALGSGVSRLVADGTGQPVEPEPRSTGPIVPELDQVRTELATARRTLAEARSQERNAERARRQLVGFVSHDLRTPLAGLRALAEGLEDGVVTDAPRAYAQMRSTVTRMSGLVDDLFALSRVEAAPEVERRPVALAELLADLTDELSPMAAAADVALRADIPADDRLAVSGDADALSRALANLVGNAVQHTGPGGRVEVRGSRAADGAIRVAVTDGCGGIPEPHLDRVFDSGWRGVADRPASELPTGGAGLGLTITQGIIAAHDGSIAVRNVDGGCCFSLELPAGQSSAA